MRVSVVRPAVAAAVLAWGLSALTLDTSAAAGIAHVTALTRSEDGARLEVVITASAPIRPRLHDIRPDWVVVDVPGADLALRPGTLPWAGGVVRKARVGQFLPTVVRIVLELTRPVPIRLIPDGPSTTVTVLLPSGGPLAARPVPRSERVRVTAVTARQRDRLVELTVAASGSVRYRLVDVRPDWIVVDIPGAELGMPAGPVPISQSLIRQVRVGQFNPDVVRVVAELLHPVRFRLALAPGAAAVVIGVPVDIGDQPVVARAQPSAVFTEDVKAVIPAQSSKDRVGQTAPPQERPAAQRVPGPAAPEAAPPPAAPTRAVGGEVVPGQGIGAVRLGMPVRDVLALLGPQKSADRLPDGEMVYRWFAPPGNDGLGVRVTPDGVVSRVWALNDVAYVLRGALKAGSTEEEVRAVLGPPSRVVENPQVKTTLLFYDALGLWVSFQRDERYAFYTQVFEIGVMPPK